MLIRLEANSFRELGCESFFPDIYCLKNRFVRILESEQKTVQGSCYCPCWHGGKTTISLLMTNFLLSTIEFSFQVPVFPFGFSHMFKFIVSIFVQPKLIQGLNQNLTL